MRAGRPSSASSTPARWTSCTSPKSYLGLSDGSHTFEVRATDAAGNTDGTPASFTWTVDAAPPDTTITAQPSDPSNVTGPSFSFTSSEGGSTFECQLDGGGWSSCTSPKTYAGLSAGSHTFEVRATDGSSNTDPTPASYTWTIDTSPPNTTITAEPSDPTNSTGASFSFTSSEGGSSFECQRDSGGWASCTSPKIYAGLSEGSHVFEVRATDAAGNTDASPASFTWTIDLTAPTSAITFPVHLASYNTAGWTNPSGTAADAVGLDRVEVSLRRVSDSLYWNGTGFADASENWRTATGTGSWSLAFAGTNFPADGDYEIRVRAVDDAANVETASSRTFTVDTVPPQTTIDTSPANPVSSTNATFTFSADQVGSSFECRIDGGAWTACTSPRNYNSLAEGSHTFDVKATDVGGNVDPSPASHTWVVDTVPPVATMDDPGQYLRGTVNLNSTSTDTGGSGVASVVFERSPAGAGTWTSIAPSWDTTGVANALYDLRVVATDVAGNSSSNPALTGRWVDNLKPTVSIVDPGPVSGTVTVDANAADAHSGVEQVELQVFDAGSWVSLGTDTSAPYQASWVTTSFPDGAHDVRAIATDFTGNVETSVGRLGDRRQRRPDRLVHGTGRRRLRQRGRRRSVHARRGRTRPRQRDRRGRVLPLHRGRSELHELELPRHGRRLPVPGRLVAPGLRRRVPPEGDRARQRRPERERRDPGHGRPLDAGYEPRHEPRRPVARLHA